MDGSGRSGRFRGSAAIVAVASILILGNCGGVSTSEAPEDASGGTAGDDAPRGGATASGGTTSDVGGSGGTSPSGTGGRGGRSPSGGTTGRGGAPPSGGLGGTLGGAPTGGRGGSAGQNCRLELIGGNRRCAEAEGYAQGPFAEWYAPPGSYDVCAAECLTRANCTAVIDYPDISSPRFGCYIYTTPCDHPSTGTWYAEDAGKDYRKVCDASGCRFEFLGYWLRCENPESVVPVQGATSIGDCEEACLANPDCTAITDYLWLNDVGGCHLFSGSCERTAGSEVGDYGETHRKVCGVGGSGGAGGGTSGTGAAGGDPDGGVGGVGGEP